jgi:hypothetical protein
MRVVRLNITSIERSLYFGHYSTPTNGCTARTTAMRGVVWVFQHNSNTRIEGVMYRPLLTPVPDGATQLLTMVWTLEQAARTH